MSQFLIEMLVISQLNESSGADPATLTNSPDYKEIEKADPAFAKNLLLAWTGDAKEYAKTAGKTKDLLFPLLFKKDYLDKKGEKLSKLPDIAKVIKNLGTLYAKTFPHVPADARIDIGIWQDVKWKKAYEAKFSEIEYEMLSEELQQIDEAVGTAVWFSVETDSSDWSDFLRKKDELVCKHVGGPFKTEKKALEFVPEDIIALKGYAIPGTKRFFIADPKFLNDWMTKAEPGHGSAWKGWLRSTDKSKIDAAMKSMTED